MANKNMKVLDGKKRVLDSKKRKKKEVIYMCMVCGQISPKVIPVKCPVCGAGKENFQKVSE